MKALALVIFLTLLPACALSRKPSVWEIDELALRGGTIVALWDRQNESVYLKKQTVLKLQEAHEKISGAGLETQLVVVQGDFPNAYAAFDREKRLIAINLAMIRLIGDDIDAYAALLCHEAAHWLKGHVESKRYRSRIIEGIRSGLDTGLRTAGISPVSLLVALGVNMGVIMIDAYFTRDDEREADSLSVICMTSTGYDPQAAVRLQETMLSLDISTAPTFLRTHPGGEERIENLKRLIRAQPSQP